MTIDAFWETDALPALLDYARIPNVSEAYESSWAELGHMDRAFTLVQDWIASRDLPDASVRRQELPGRSPLLVVDVPGTAEGEESGTVLLYGHLDKQPEMTGWRDGLGPWEPQVIDGRLFGRGTADDGYAGFASVGALEELVRRGAPHARCLLLLEGSEESGSPDLPAHLEALGEQLGTPDLVVALDSGALDYDRLWITTSLRGLVQVVLTVEVLTEGVHSGSASGIVPSSFRILRQLLDRLEDSATGRILLPELSTEIPADVVTAARATAEAVGGPEGLPFVDGVQPMVADPAEQLLARTWQPTLSVTGADGWPPTSRAGNVLRPSTSLALSFRLPPTVDSAVALEAVRVALTTDVPSGAKVTLTGLENADGWFATPLEPWAAQALDEASTRAFGQGARSFGEGGSIPFMGMLGERFPDAQIVVTGVLGPESNAHGPNEFLDLPTARRITAVVADLLEAHGARRGAV